MICLCSKYVKNCNIFGQILNNWVKLILKKFHFFFQCLALPKDPQSFGSQNLRCPFSISQYYRRRRLCGCNYSFSSVCKIDENSQNSQTPKLPNPTDINENAWPMERLLSSPFHVKIDSMHKVTPKERIAHLHNNNNYCCTTFVTFCPNRVRTFIA